MVRGSSHYPILIGQVQICEFRGGGYHPLDDVERSESIREGLGVSWGTGIWAELEKMRIWTCGGGNREETAFKISYTFLRLFICFKQLGTHFASFLLAVYESDHHVTES